MDDTQASRARVRRAPKIGVFIGVGAILGILVTIIVTTSFPADPSVGMWATVAYMSLFGVTGGIVLGAVAALIADRVSRRRTRVVTVERGKVTHEADDVASDNVPENTTDDKTDDKTDAATSDATSDEPDQA